MTGMLAVAALTLAALGWLAIRWAEERERLDNLLTTIAATELPPTCNCEDTNE